MSQRKQYHHMVAMNQLIIHSDFKLLQFETYLTLSRKRKKIYEVESTAQYNYLKFIRI